MKTIEQKSSFLWPVVGTADLLDCKAVGQLASQGALVQWVCGELQCSGIQGGEKDSDSSVDRVGQVEADHLWETQQQNWERHMLS